MYGSAVSQKLKFVKFIIWFCVELLNSIPPIVKSKNQGLVSAVKGISIVLVILKSFPTVLVIVAGEKVVPL